MDTAGYKVGDKVVFKLIEPRPGSFAALKDGKTARVTAVYNEELRIKFSDEKYMTVNGNCLITKVA